MIWHLKKALVMGALLFASTGWAATWNIIQNQDCTALRVATITLEAGGTQAAVANCCTGLKNGFCNKRMNFGDLFEYFTYAVANGTYGGAGGDAISATQARRIGLSVIEYATCNVVNNGVDPATAIFHPLLRRTSPLPTIQLFVGTTGLEVGAVSISGLGLNCIVYGY